MNPSFFLSALLIVVSAPSARAGVTTAPPPAASEAATAPCPTLWRHTFNRLQDEKPMPLCQYTGQVVLVVNTASYCGFTSQYKGLEALYARYKDRGLVVLGFPANDFGRQEPGENKAIADFCENTFGVKFPMVVKTHVVGRDANPLYRELGSRTGDVPQWNFHKYLVDRSGQTVLSYASGVEPDDPRLIRDLEKLIGQKK